VIDHLARNGKKYRPAGSEFLEHPVRGKRSAPWRRNSTSACNDPDIVPEPSLCSRGPSPRRSLQRATRPASGPPTANGTMAGAIGNRLVGRHPKWRPEMDFYRLRAIFWDPHLIDGAMQRALVPSAVRIDQRTHRNLSDAPNRGFQRAQ
jgi:hypothetical protein